VWRKVPEKGKKMKKEGRRKSGGRGGEKKSRGRDSSKEFLEWGKATTGNRKPTSQGRRRGVEMSRSCACGM